MWRCGDNVLTIISTYIIFMQLQSQSWQILNLESNSFAPWYFCPWTERPNNIYKIAAEANVLWPINDKCFFFLRKWSHSFLSSVYFQCLVFFHSVPIWSPLKSLCFQSSTVWLCCFLVLLLWCVFCQRKFTGTLAYLTDTMSHQAFLKRNYTCCGEVFSVSSCHPPS